MSKNEKTILDNIRECIQQFSKLEDLIASKDIWDELKLREDAQIITPNQIKIGLMNIYQNKFLEYNTCYHIRRLRKNFLIW